MSKEHDDHEAFKLVSHLYSFCDGLESAGEAVWNLDQFIAREPRLVRFPKHKPLGSQSGPGPQKRTGPGAGRGHSARRKKAGARDE